MASELVKNTVSFSALSRDMMEKIVAAAKPQFTGSAYRGAWEAANLDAKLEEALERLMATKVSAAYKAKVSAGVDRWLAGETEALEGALNAKVEVLASEFAAQKSVIEDKRSEAFNACLGHARALVVEARDAVRDLVETRERQERDDAAAFGIEHKPSPVLTAMAATFHRLRESASYPGGPFGVFGDGQVLRDRLRWIAPRK